MRARGSIYLTRRPAPSLISVRLQGVARLLPCFLLAFASTMPVALGETGSTEFFRLIEEMQQAYAAVDHYTATFLIQERVDAELGPTQHLALKFKKPFKIYLRWLTGKNEGRQALYPAGADGNELWVRASTLLGAVTVSLDPHSPRARKGKRHAITDTGIGRLLDIIADNVYRGLQHSELSIDNGGLRTTLDRPTQRFTLHFPDDPNKGYYARTAIIDLDREHRLPIYAEIFDWNGQLVERYGYLELRINPGLSDEDFDPKNPEYGF
jgi:outer membrane lipoprotein-sorting protein